MNLRSAAAFAACIFSITLAACKPAESPKASPDSTSLLVSAEDLYTLRNDSVASGPAITGSIQPERRADLRAEVSATVMQVFKENGDPVKRGDLMVRLDDTAIRDALASAEAAARAAVQALDQANRQLERLKTLRLSGMATAQSLEDTEIRRNSTQSEAEAAKARVVSARQQLTRTEVRAPFDGLVSDRKVSAGDTAQIGKELMKVIDPASLRFEGLVAADHVGTVKPGQAVHFNVSGYGEREFAGRVRRVNPAANATTRQVEVLVDLTGNDQPRLAGLYAEGRIEAEANSHLLLPSSALVRDGDKAYAWVVKEGAVRKVPIVLGERDPRSGGYIVVQGLAAGDQLLKYPSALLKDGRRVEMAGEGGTAQGR
jgi:membrane fusion protein (multidrug efflux system)